MITMPISAMRSPSAFRTPEANSSPTASTSFVARVTQSGNAHKVLAVALNDGTPIKSVEIKVDDGPWPAFPADLTSIALVAATQCHGTVLIHEKMFESRMFFTDKLVAMGATIVLCDPHRAVVVGPRPLQGGTVESPDIRAGMALLIAALGAEGTSRIHNIRQIERGYEAIDTRLTALGAKIRRDERADW